MAQDPDPLVDVVADATLLILTGGLCRLEKICALCDCFADVDEGRSRDERMREQAKEALETQRRTHHPYRQPLERARLEALCRLFVESGDMTPFAQIKFEQVAAGDA